MRPVAVRDPGSLVRAWRLAELLLPGVLPLVLESPALLSARDLRGDPSLPLPEALPQPRPEAVQGDLPVSVLAPLVAGDDHDSGRAVSQTHPALGRVLVLASLAARPEGVHPAFGEERVVVPRDRRSRSASRAIRRGHGSFQALGCEQGRDGVRDPGGRPGVPEFEARGTAGSGDGRGDE